MNAPTYMKAKKQTQLEIVKAFMRRGGWKTLEEISYALRIPEASASARLRDLRKPKFGGYEVKRRACSFGWEPRFYEYKLQTY